MVQQILMNGLIVGSIYALIALGFTVIYRTVRFLHLAHGIVFSVGAYTAYSFTTHAVQNITVAFFFG